MEKIQGDNFEVQTYVHSNVCMYVALYHKLRTSINIKTLSIDKQLKFYRYYSTAASYLQRNHNWFPDNLFTLISINAGSWFINWLTRSIDRKSKWFSTCVCLLSGVHNNGNYAPHIASYTPCGDIRNEGKHWMENFWTLSAGSSMRKIKKFAVNVFVRLLVRS